MAELLATDTLLAALTAAISAHVARHQYTEPWLVGIRRGGVWVAQHLQQQLNYSEPPGELNIAFYRDDFSTLGVHPEVGPSQLTTAIDGRHIILVDDVLYTGRTVRAALSELFDYGRPASITLAVLVARDGRVLPIQADIVGQTVTLNPDEYIKLHGPESLALELRQRR